MKATNIPLSTIRRDTATQPRAGLYTDTVDDYAEALAVGAIFPEVVVFDDGTDRWLADGYHRVAAAVKAGLTEIAAEVRQGSRRDAILFSVGANATHGLPRTRADKRRAVETLLLDDEWRQWSDREIGKRCHVDGKTVASIRATLSAEIPQIDRRTCTRGGTAYTVNTASIGIPPEEVERRVAEARAKAEAEAVAADARAAATAQELSALKAKSAEKAAAASRREANLIQAKDEALADKKRALADKAVAEKRAADQAERAAEAAWQEADEKYDTRINQLAREAAEAKALAERREHELAAAVDRAQADAKAAADAMAEALVAKKLETRKKELAEIEEKYNRAKRNAESAHAAKERLDRDLKLTRDAIKQHEAEVARWASGEAETTDQVRIATALSEALGRALTELTMLEHGPQPAAMQKLQRAAQICRQMAEAIEAFLTGPAPASGGLTVINGTFNA